MNSTLFLLPGRLASRFFMSFSKAAGITRSKTIFTAIAFLIATGMHAQTITTGSVVGPFCAGSKINVPYTFSGGTTVLGSNVFTAQISDASGSFANPINIGTFTNTNNTTHLNWTVPATIPSTIVQGTGYRVRVISSSPAATGSANSTDITLYEMYTGAQIFVESNGSVSGNTTVSSHETANGFDNDSFTMSSTGGSGCVLVATNPSSGYTGASGGANVRFSGPSSFTISGINTTAYSQLGLGFGILKNSSATDGTALVVAVSSDGTNWTDLSFPPLPTGGGTNNSWYYRVVTGTIPSTANLRIRFTYTGSGSNLNIDDIELGNAVSPATVSLSPTTAQYVCSPGTVALTATNVANAIYAWSNGGTSNSITATSTGNYSVTASDLFGCSVSRGPVSVTIQNNFTPAVSITSDLGSTICNGNTVNFTATPVAGGSSPTYQWKLNGSNVGINSPSYSNGSLANGNTVSVTMTSNIACPSTTTANSNTITMTVRTRPTGVLSGTQNICNGSSGNLSIAVTGTGPWTGTLSSGQSFSGSSSPITVSVSPSATTTYTLASLSDANCTSNSGDLSGSALVTVRTRPTGIISGTQGMCAGGSASLSIAVTGTGPWSGTLSNGQSFSGSSSPISVSVSPTSATTYTIATLSDANCSSIAADLSGSATVSILARPVGILSGSTTICNGDSGNLLVAVNGTGPWSGALSDGTSFSGSGSPITVSVSPSSTTSYTIASLNDANCASLAGNLSGSGSVTVNQRPTSNISGSATICNGNSTAISIAVTGAGPWTGALSNGQSFSGSSSPISVSVSPTATTTYTVSSLSGSQCASISADRTGSFTVNVNARPTAVITGTQTICNGSSATLSIALTGTGPWSGSLSNGQSFSGASSPITVSVSPTASASYSVSSLNDANCSAQAGDLGGSATVTVLSRPTATLSGNQSICPGSSATLSLNVTGTGPWSGSLSDGSSFSGSTSPLTVVVSPSTNSTYTIASLNDANCSAVAGDLSGSANVTLYTLPSGTLAGNQTVCAGSTATIYINATGSGTISGTLNPGAIPFSGSGFIMIDVTPSSTTTYTIASLSDANCSADISGMNGSATVSVQTTPAVSITGSTSVCAGSSANVSFSGPADAWVNYMINGGPEQSVLLNGSGSATVNTGVVLTNKIYSLVSVDDGICIHTVSGSATITKVDLPDASISGTISICPGNNSNITFTGTSGAQVTYTINGGAPVNVNLDGSGNAVVNSGALSSSATYTLVSVSNGTCTQTIGSTATITVVGNTYYQDNDNDGFGNSAVSIVACTTPAGYVLDNTDCCDTNGDINPLTEWWYDGDNDGYGGFMIANGCTPADCTPSNWPAQYIPYYPVAHAGTAYANDCNDSNVSVRPGASEICNNSIDEDCDGIVNDGCAVVVNDAWSGAVTLNTSNPNALYPNSLNYNGSLFNATVSPQGNASNVETGGGRDLWYKFVAPSTAIRIRVVPSNFDAVIELQNASAVQLDVENVNNTIGGIEVLNYGSLVVGQTYYIAVRNFHNTNTGTFAIAASPMMPSGCAYTTPAGGFSLCQSYKAIYRGAASYTFNFTGVGGTAALTTASVTTSGLVPMTHPSLALRYGGVYDVRVDANFVSLNGIGTPEYFTVIGGSPSGFCDNVTILNSPQLEVKSNQRCPTILTRNQFLIAEAIGNGNNACGAISYTYEFTAITSCSNSAGTGASFTVDTPGNSPFLMLASAFPVAGTSTSYWRVRIRANFSYGSGSYGPPRTIGISGVAASMEMEDENGEEAQKGDPAAAIDAYNVYPNPTDGTGVNLKLMTDEGSKIVNVMVYDALGRCVVNKQYTTEGSLNTFVPFDSEVENGIYTMTIHYSGQTRTERIVVSK